MIRLAYMEVMKEVKQPANFDQLLDTLSTEFGVESHNMHFTFFFLDEDGDVLSVSSQSDFADNDDVLLASG